MGSFLSVLVWGPSIGAFTSGPGFRGILYDSYIETLRDELGCWDSGFLAVHRACEHRAQEFLPKESIWIEETEALLGSLPGAKGN